jgi:glycerol-3-phosphate acyltransferase PlsY
MQVTGVLIVLTAYLMGSVDFAVLIARARGTDIYSVGSGNPGASNVLRTMGRLPAALVLIGDFSKGAAAAGLGLILGDVTLAAAAGFFAVLGHCYPVFHRFRGGKGMATGAGMNLVAFPVPTVILLGGWVVLVAVTKVSSIGSLTVMVLIVPMLAWFGVPGSALIWVGAMALLVVYRHHGNIGRLLRRAEFTVTPHDR